MSELSACLIVRDEEELLPGCLASLRAWADEICVLDTGSIDATPRIAREAGARLGHFDWCEDFALARNRSLELASRPWILVIDADERLDPATGPALRRALEDRKAAAFLVDQANLDGRGGVRSIAIPRLFRSGAGLRFSHPVHESIMDSLMEAGYPDPRPCGARLIHHGYLPRRVAERDKRARNLRILRRRAGEDPRDLFNAYKLAGTLRAAGDTDKAVAVYRALVAALRAADAERCDQLPFLPRVSEELRALLAERPGPAVRRRRARRSRASRARRGRPARPTSTAPGKNGNWTAPPELTSSTEESPPSPAAPPGRRPGPAR